MTIGENIRLYRKRRKMTQNQFGKAIGLDQSNISDYECGKYIPGIFNLLSIADVLEVSLDELVGRKFKPKEDGV